MALHKTPTTMLNESLDEMLEAAKYCIEYKKTDKKFTPYNTGGCLGYPGGILLFSIIDTIGSYFRKDTTFKVLIDSKLEAINAEGWEHFKILNSKYFNQNLSAEFLNKLYSIYRSRLTHNSILGKDALMHPDTKSLNNPKIKNVAFATIKDTNGKIVYLLFMNELYQVCENAVKEFKKDIEAVVPISKIGKKFY